MLNKYEEKMIESLKNVLGGEQKAFSYHQENGKKNSTPYGDIDILFAKSSPSKGYLTASTLGMVNRTTGYKDKNSQKEIRAELIMSSYGGSDLIGKILSTAAIGICDNGIQYGYGTLLKGILEGYLPNSDMKHLFLMLPPPIWSDKFKVIDCEDSIVVFLYALPISDAEKEYMAEHGIDELQNHFVQENIDMFDLNRKSVL
ncbi:MAG: suppressor of fused domain protein [Oscillospiraceae bacterium]|nr:suppressor of fused domain protein [Oscillospiraceae bacterium]